MENLISEIFEIIKDYRADENLMSEEIIQSWINQFNEGDREFVLQEMKSILEKRYISKEKAKKLVKEMITFLAGKFEFDTPKNYLLASSFIDNQHEGKSQKVLLKFVDEIIQSEFGISITDCNPEKPQFYIYVDDVLCTGDTLIKNLTKKTEEDKGWFNLTNENGKTNFELFKENNSKLVLSFFSIHQPNMKTARNKIYYEMGKQNVDFVYAWDTQYAVDRAIINGSSLNFIFPKEELENELVINCKNQIEAKVQNAGYHKNESIIFRANDKPEIETFFSSPENRDRFEKIILEKCIEIYNSSPRLMSEMRPRPLGYGFYTDFSLGFGTLIFTWRNVPYNVPLVFWYKSKNWFPLFERNHT